MIFLLDYISGITKRYISFAGLLRLEECERDKKTWISKYRPFNDLPYNFHIFNDFYLLETLAKFPSNNALTLQMTDTLNNIV